MKNITKKRPVKDETMQLFLFYRSRKQMWTSVQRYLNEHVLSAFMVCTFGGIYIIEKIKNAPNSELYLWIPGIISAFLIIMGVRNVIVNIFITARLTYLPFTHEEMVKIGIVQSDEETIRNEFSQDNVVAPILFEEISEKQMARWQYFVSKKIFKSHILWRYHEQRLGKESEKAFTALYGVTDE